MWMWQMGKKLNKAESGLNYANEPNNNTSDLDTTFLSKTLSYWLYESSLFSSLGSFLLDMRLTHLNSRHYHFIRFTFSQWRIRCMDDQLRIHYRTFNYQLVTNLVQINYILFAMDSQQMNKGLFQSLRNIGGVILVPKRQEIKKQP